MKLSADEIFDAWIIGIAILCVIAVVLIFIALCIAKPMFGMGVLVLFVLPLIIGLQFN